jgi:ABC-type Fe3+-hydroxamate transport system substrate-binding protein
MLSRVVGALPTADARADAYDSELTRRKTDRAAAATGPSVLMLAWDSPPIVIGGGSFLSQMVELAGGRNLFADLAGPSATVSIESIAARDPDLVLFVGDAEPTIAARPEWQVVPAIRDRRFVRVNGTEFSWPSFRSLDGITEIAAALAGVLP